MSEIKTNLVLKMGERAAVFYQDSIAYLAKNRDVVNAIVICKGLNESITETTFS